MKRLAIVVMVALLGVMPSIPARAGLEKVEEKLNRGATNFVAFWIEIPYQLVEAFQENPATGLPVGLGMAIVMMPARLGSGIVDMVTCPVPFPVKDYGPMFEPEINPWIE